MIKLKLSLVVGLVLTAFTGLQAAKLTFKVGNAPAQSKVILNFHESGDKKEVAIDADGNGSIEATDFTPQYVTMQYTRGRRNIYLDPKQDLTISFNSSNMWKETQFEGAGAAINNYLASGKIQSLGMPDMSLEEGALLLKGDSLYNASCDLLEAANLPADFTQREKVRLLYQTYAYYSSYAFYHGYMTKNDSFVPSDAYYAKLKELTQIDADLLRLKEYQSFLPNAITVLSAQGVGADVENSVLNKVQYVDAHVNDAAVSAYLVNDFVYSHVDRNGLDNTDELVVLFRKHVKDAKLVEAFDKLSTRWEALRAGKPSPTFTYKDMEGKAVSLADLKGNYVYIDIWATWCGPCRAEIPALKELEHKYAGKDIYFVSISTDKDKKAWEEMVKKDDLKGIQLHIDGDRSFMNAYFVTGIPRFILIDKEGNIVSANMSRPSNPKTAQLFDELLKK